MGVCVGRAVLQRGCLLIFSSVLISPVLVGSLTAQTTNIDLGGTWQYQIVTDITYPPPANWLSTTVPGYTSSTNYAKAWFRKTFTLPSPPAGYRVKLQFGGVKYRSTVYLNGQNVGGCYNGYDPFELDATTAALPGSLNELLVSVTDWTGLFSAPVDFSGLQPGESARDRANNVVLAPIGGLFNLFGIWEPVGVAFVPEVSISEVFIIPSVRQQQLQIRAKVRNDSAVSVSTTLHHRLLEGTNQVLTLPDQTLTLGAGGVLQFETNVAWSSPRLWTPEDPWLYMLESSVAASGVTPHTNRTRFGFREFWTTAGDFYLNGTRMHLLATSCWPPYNNPVSDATIRKSLQDIKAGNNKAFRLHTQPWPAAWYRIADEVGLLIVEEAAVWCDPRAYRLSDPVFWSNYADHLRAAVKRDANHPSLIMWSLENEILHCGGDRIFSGTITNLAQLGLLVKSLDSTRPITFEADLDPGGVADVLGLHYPHEYPDFNFWPDTAYWMDQSIPKSYVPGGQWKWDRTKPLYIGEHLWIPDTSPEGLSILFGDLGYFDKSHYRQLAKAWTWEMQIEAYRWYGVSGHCPWTMVEDPNASGIENLNTNRNRLYQVEAAVYHPNAVIVREYDARFFTGEAVDRSLSVYNDTPAGSDFVLQWSVNGNTQTRTVNLSAGDQTMEPVSFTVPGTAGSFNFDLRLWKQGALVYSNTLAYEARTPVALSQPVGRRIGVYDPTGTTFAIFAGLKYAVVTNLATAPYGSLDLLVVGRNALAAETIPSIGTNTISGQWHDFMSRGGWVLMLEQTNYPPWIPLGLGLANEAASMGFPVTEHPLVADLGLEHFRWWRGDHAIANASIRIPTRGNFVPVLHIGSQGGLDRAGLLEAAIGRGGLLACQLLLVSKFSTEPIAVVLLQRLLNYSFSQASGHYAGLWTEPGSVLDQKLQSVGLVAENLSGRIGATDLNRFPVLILAAANSAWTEATQNLVALQTYVERGGRLLVHRPSEGFLTACASLFLPNATWGPNVSTPIVRSVPGMPPRRITNHDLYWVEDPGNWNREATLATNIATRTYRKNFNLATHTTIEVENMPIKTSGGAISGGWMLWANGYVATNITVSQTGPYLFAVIASGTPVAGVYPHMVLRIDGKFADAVTVASSSWQTNTLTAWLTTGTHELALVFDNDAWAPPEDRNLSLDKVRYGPDPTPGTPYFLTKPGAVLETTHGAGSVMFDEIAWEAPGKSATRAERYLSSLLTDRGALIQTSSELRIEAELMQPVNVSAIYTNNGIVWLNSGGYLQKAVNFSETGTYVFDLAVYGTPAAGTNARAALKIDGATRGTVEATESLSTFSITTTVTAGNHNVQIEFINDYYQPPADRNLAVDAISIQPLPRPEILELSMGSGSGRCTITWISQPGKTYDVEYTPALGQAWGTVGTVTPSGTAASWTDDGTGIGQPPGTGTRQVSFYRVKQR